jgi:putative FmdB family regulatory protein
VPTYEYECLGCRRVFEVRQRISEPPLSTCDTCGGQVRRLLSAAPFILKGEGWYVTDYPSAARKKALESEKGGDSKPAGEKTSGEKSSGEKSSGEQSSTPSSPPAATTPASTSPSGASTSSSD